MSYYNNVAQPLTKEDFDRAIKAMKESNKVKYEQSPILYVLPPVLYKRFIEDK